MKKNLLILVAAMLFVSGCVYAKQYNDLPKNSLSLSYGMAPVSEIIDDFGNAIGSAFALGLVGNYKIADKTCFGVVNVDYAYNVLPWLAVGANVSYSGSKGDIVDKDKNVFGNEKDVNLTLMPTVRLDWLRRKNVSLYTRLSVGANYLHRNTTSTSDGETTDNDFMWMGHVSPIGLEVGSPQVCGFAELGFGQAGVIQIGVRTRF